MGVGKGRNFKNVLDFFFISKHLNVFHLQEFKMLLIFEMVFFTLSDDKRCQPNIFKEIYQKNLTNRLPLNQSQSKNF